ncbi:MAG: ATP-grasp domain-containing protein [Nitrososphaerales archaeon]
MTDTVLVIPAGQLATVVIRCLRKDPSLRIVSADTNFLAPGLHLADKGYLIPPASDPTFYDRVSDIIAKESVDVIYPASHPIIPVLASLVDKFSNVGAKLLISKLETLDKCLDKWQTYQYLSRSIPMPKSTIENNTEYILDNIGLPAFIKPRNGSGSKNVHKLEDVDDVHYFVKKTPNPIVQEFITGESCAIDILVNDDGKFLCGVTRKVLEVSDGISIKAVIEPRKDLVMLAKKICNILKFFGVIGISFIIDHKDSKPKLIEINPRTPISVNLSTAAGYNMPLSAVYLALGKPVNLNRQVPNILYVSRYYEEIFLEHVPTISEESAVIS